MIDPICGMTVEQQTAAGKYKYDGRTYLFCSVSCLEKFKAEPEKYLAPKPEQPPHPTLSLRERVGRGKPAHGELFILARWIPRCANLNLGHAPNAEWH